MNMGFMDQYLRGAPGAGAMPGAAPSSVTGGPAGGAAPAVPGAPGAPAPIADVGPGGVPVLPVPEAGPESELPQLDPFRSSDVERVVEMQKNAGTWSEMTPLFDAIEKDMKVFETGPMANLERQGRSLAALVGFGDEKVLAAGERLSKNMNKLVSENMAFLKGAMSEGEREFTKQFSLSMDSSPAGNRAYIAFLREVAMRAKQKAPMARRYFRENGNSLDGFDEVWMSYVGANPVKIPDIEGLSAESESLQQEREQLRKELGLD
jgi:hypothetical protein